MAFSSRGKGGIGTRAVSMPRIFASDCPSYLPIHNNAQFANFILRNYICFFMCHLPPSPPAYFQSRFADALLRELAGVIIPPERIYGLGSGLVCILLLCLRHCFYFFDNKHNFSPYLISYFSSLIPKCSFQSQGRSVEAASEETRAPRTDTTVRYFAVLPIHTWPICCLLSGKV